MVTTMTRRAAQTPLAQQITRMDTGRLRAYRENLEFYQGRQWADPTRRRERRLTLNYAKAVIEKTASYTMSGLSFLVDPEDGSAEAAARARRAERALREIQEANNLEQLEFDNEIDCSVLGDAAYKVTWDSAEKRVRVTAPDVQGCLSGRGATTPRDCGGWRRDTCSGTKRPRCCTGRSPGPRKRGGASTRSSRCGRTQTSSYGLTARRSSRARTRTASSRS